LRSDREALHKTPTALIYSSKLYDLKLSEISIFFDQEKNNNLDLNENMIKAFDHFIDCLNLFFDMSDITSVEDCRIKTFGSVTLNNGAILHAINKFHNRP